MFWKNTWVTFNIFFFLQDKIVPPDPITAVEKTKTLQRLNQVIQHRLVTSKLPPEMGQMIIGKKKASVCDAQFVEVSVDILLSLLKSDCLYSYLGRWEYLDQRILGEWVTKGKKASFPKMLFIKYSLADTLNASHSFSLCWSKTTSWFATADEICMYQML